MIKSVERAQMLKQLSRLLLASNGAASQMHNMPAKCRVVAGMQKRLSSSFANPNETAKTKPETRTIDQAQSTEDWVRPYFLGQSL
ncbi:hypothetical protein RP20_CCG012910 [Aedes albopictus]|nr:hypothetical protein RP20_CCG012910 [Aedes albopictus]